MKGRVITDLQGHTFTMGDYKVSAMFPHEFTRGKSLVFNSDVLSHTSFILVKGKDKDDYGYVIYSNYYYIYGSLKLDKYEPEKDIRYKGPKKTDDRKK